MADTTIKKRDRKEGKEEREHKSSKRHRHEDVNGKRKHKKRKDSDAEDEGMWVERTMDAKAEPQAPVSALQRDDWMLEPSAATSSAQKTGMPGIPVEEEGLTEGYGDVPQNSRTLGGGVDFFSSLGTERAKKPQPDRLNPDQLHISSKELNIELKNPTEPAPPTAAPKAVTPGGPGSSWRMIRLRRAYETAEEEGRPVDEVAIERFGSLEAFEQAKEERRILNEREGRRGERMQGKGKERERPRAAGGRGERGIMYTDIAGSGASSRSSSFKQPGGMARSGAGTPSARPREGAPSWQRFDSMHLPSEGGTPGSHFHTPVPSIAPAPAPPPTTGRAMSPSSLNKMQAKVLRAKLMNDPNAKTLEAQYEAELSKAHEAQAGGGREQVNVMPVVDARGRLYDVGSGKDNGPLPQGNRMKKEKPENPLEQSSTLEEMLRQERVGGADTQKQLDNQCARSIMTDSGFENDLDYTDDYAEKLARQKMRSDAMKRQFAIQDYKRTQQALATCPFCYGEDDSLPKAPVIALGTRVYLSCTVQEELVPGHCLIVPIQHHLTMLEADNDVWDEVRNFMKSLMQMFAEEDKGVVFYETILTLKSQKHTVIECVPVPWEQFDILPGYFKESIMMSEAEWSQHNKLIDFSKRGGFRRMMVPNLPYFMVQFDHKGEKGYGHVIEGTSEAVDEDDPTAEGDKGGGDFPWYFAGEIIGNVLELEPRRWRHPRRLSFGQNKERVAGFRKKYEKYDWTPMIGRS